MPLRVLRYVRRSGQTCLFLSLATPRRLPVLRIPSARRFSRCLAEAVCLNSRFANELDARFPIVNSAGQLHNKPL